MKTHDIESIGVVGGGVMGSGIAQTAIVAGFKTVCRELSERLNERTKSVIVDGKFGLKSSVDRGAITQEQMDRALSNLVLTTSVSDLADCDLIIEAVGGDPGGQIENLDVKLRVFAELDEIVKDEAIFASNTSFLTIATLAAATKRQDKFIGMHWFSPANVMKLVEVTYTPHVSENLIRQIEDLCKRFGKTTVRVKDVPGDTGFIVNRIFRVARLEAEKIVAEGIATAEDVNTAMILGRKWPVGPLPVQGAASARTGWR